VSTLWHNRKFEMDVFFEVAFTRFIKIEVLLQYIFKKSLRTRDAYFVFRWRGCFMSVVVAGAVSFKCFVHAVDITKAKH
jgi:hypothetical protein